MISLSLLTMNLIIVAIALALVGVYKLGYHFGYQKSRQSYGDMLRRAGSRFGERDL